MARRRRKPNDEFGSSLLANDACYFYYRDMLTELATTMFEWKNMPDTIDVRYLEMTLFLNGQALFFKDEVLGFLALKSANAGRFNVYGIPNRRRAYAENNGYHKWLNKDNSVLIYNNYLHTNSYDIVNLYAHRLWNLDRIIDVNTNAQKTPILVRCKESQKLTLKNVYKEYDGNAPVIYAYQNFDPNDLQVLTTGAPYISDKIYTLKTQIINEFLTRMGISNTNYQKRERLISEEVQRSQGATIASRYSRVESRRQACEQINKMFNLDIDCVFREDYRVIDEMITPETLNPNTDEMSVRTLQKGGDSNE